MPDAIALRARIQEWLNTSPDQLRREGGAEICGVCEKPGASVFWFSDISRAAHEPCYACIQQIEEIVLREIAACHGNDFTHKDAIRAVRAELGGRSIRQFWADEGTERLQEIFDRAGVAAVRAERDLLVRDLLRLQLRYQR